MADQKNRGGQKSGDQDPAHAEKHQGATPGGAGERSDKDKRDDQKSNPDDDARTATDKQR